MSLNLPFSRLLLTSLSIFFEGKWNVSQICVYMKRKNCISIDWMKSNPRQWHLNQSAMCAANAHRFRVRITNWSRLNKKKASAQCSSKCQHKSSERSRHKEEKRAQTIINECVYSTELIHKSYAYVPLATFWSYRNVSIFMISLFNLK